MQVDTPAHGSDVLRNCDCANAPPLQNGSTTASRKASSTSLLGTSIPTSNLLLLFLLFRVFPQPVLRRPLTQIQTSAPLDSLLHRFDWLERLSLPICRGPSSKNAMHRMNRADNASTSMAALYRPTVRSPSPERVSSPQQTFPIHACSRSVETKCRKPPPTRRLSRLPKSCISTES